MEYLARFKYPFLVFLFVFDVLMYLRVYPDVSLAEKWQNFMAKSTNVAQSGEVVKASPEPSAEPDQEDKKVVSPSTQPSPLASATPEPTNDPNSSATPTPTANDTASPTPTPTPTQTATPTPTPAQTPSPTPTPATTSPVYIMAYIYENGNQIIGQQLPVKVVNMSTNEVLYSTETGNDGKSPTWNIPANTAIKITLYQRSGFGGCGEEWSLTTGNLGTLETHDLSIQGGRTPCITL